MHPDPRPKESDEKRRLTSKRFLDMYEHLLVPAGKVRLKTDAQDLFAYSVESFAQNGRNCISKTNDLHASELLSDHFGVVTDYEQAALRK